MLRKIRESMKESRGGTSQVVIIKRKTKKKIHSIPQNRKLNTLVFENTILGNTLKTSLHRS